MNVTGSYTFAAPRQQVWALIHSPAALIEIIPGCQGVEQVSATEYRGRIQLKLPAIVGDYTTSVRLTDFCAPKSCTFAGRVEGAPGAISGTASFTLTENEAGQTVINYRGQGQITGALARLNDRFVAGLAKTLIGQGLAQLDKQLQADAAPGAIAGGQFKEE
ncbi:MAG: hypothetical protein FOGNACKC_05213 [Anaerolineae bacterium]|nr:hypothetical protein [Anaerolineae bacterium]